MGMQMTVRSAYAQVIDVSATVVLGDGVSVDSVRSDIESSVRTAISGVEPGGILRLARIHNSIFQSGPVVDYSSVQMCRSGGSFASSNIQLLDGEQAVLGTLTLAVS